MWQLLHWIQIFWGNSSDASLMLREKPLQKRPGHGNEWALTLDPYMSPKSLNQKSMGALGNLAFARPQAHMQR